MFVVVFSCVEGLPGCLNSRIVFCLPGCDPLRPCGELLCAGGERAPNSGEVFACLTGAGLGLLVGMAGTPPPPYPGGVCCVFGVLLRLPLEGCRGISVYCLGVFSGGLYGLLALLGVVLVFCLQRIEPGGGLFSPGGLLVGVAG